MFIYKICHDLSKECGLNYYSVNHNKYNRYYFDTEETNLADITNWENRTGCFAPLRYYFDIPQELKAHIILHLRDPRDVLVSLYFSEAYSHSVFKGVFDLSRAERNEIISMGIDNYVLKYADTFNRKYTEYHELLTRPGSLFVKYEDLVLNFPFWLQEVAKGFAIENTKFINRLIKKYQGEFTVTKENIHAHKRKIVPGDYKEKLASGTIERLNGIFLDNLKKYNYEI
ncbi:MAG: sulfotransferase domain-containing protein [Deltaproteobacteria bacterium]|nr:sulfotransferase domain-containing protein [Deltaproteobacteria bacterium]